MKKKYDTPHFIVEPFQLDTAIANCSGDGGIAIGRTAETCMHDSGYFSNACPIDAVNPNDPNDTICYHGPIGNTPVFAS